MKFSEPIPVSANLVSWSPDGKYLGVALSSRLQIRRAKTLQTEAVFLCSECIQSIGWSPDSELIFAANFKVGVTEVWCIKNPSWTCKIEEGAVGLLDVIWAPDSRHILTTADFHLRLTVWSLVGSSVSYIKNPKNISSGCVFNNGGEYLVVAERKDCKDFLSIFDTSSWVQLKHFETATSDLQGVKWAPNDSVLVVWDSPLEYKIVIYDIGGHTLASFSAYQWALGVRCVNWCPKSCFLGVGSYDKKVRLMNYVTWTTLVEFSHSLKIEEEGCVVYKEDQSCENPLDTIDTCGLKSVYVEETCRPVIFEAVQSSDSPGEPKTGVKEAQFSQDGRYLASLVEDTPGVVWVWNIYDMKLKCVLNHCDSVTDIKWCPNQTRLAICTGGNHAYLWTPFGVMSVTVPGVDDLQITSLRWNSSGSSLLLIDREKFIVCFIDS